jgi:hypothetical protein
MQPTRAIQWVLAGVALSASAGAMARDNGSAETTLADLRSKCEMILGNPQMVRPTITITCDEHNYVWRACPSSFDLTDSRTVGSTIGMKDWTVEQGRTFDTRGSKDCAVYSRHHVYTRPVEDTMRCEDLLAQLNTADDLTSHCEAVLSERVQQDAGLRTDEGPTGDIINTCSGRVAPTQVGQDGCPVDTPQQQTGPQQQQGGGDSNVDATVWSR